MDSANSKRAKEQPAQKDEAFVNVTQIVNSAIDRKVTKKIDKLDARITKMESRLTKLE